MSALPHAGWRVREAVGGEDVESSRRLLSLYLAEFEPLLGDIFARQDFRGELAALPGHYTRPGGALLLAEVNGRAAGCIAVRRFDRDDCELKRLYVDRPFRGLSLGRLLVEAALEVGVDLGYRRALLDSTPEMVHALALYRDLGFLPIAPYGGPGQALCFARPLRTGPPPRQGV